MKFQARAAAVCAPPSFQSQHSLPNKITRKPMAESGALEGLRGLHQDLIALGESRLPNIDRLWAELEARIDEFRRLLDKPAKSDASRKALQTGPL